MTTLVHAARMDCRLGRRAESWLYLALVVCLHAVVLAALSQARAPSEARVPVVVELIVPEPSAPPGETVRRESLPRAAVPRPRDLAQRQVPLNDSQPSSASQEKRAPAAVPEKRSAVASSEPSASATAEATERSRSEPSSGAAPPASGAVSNEASPTPSAQLPAPQTQPPSFDAPHLRNPRAEYPRLSRRMGEQGRVVLRVYVTKTGLPERIDLQSSSGSPRLDQAAREAVRQWNFVPARRGNESVDAWLLVPIVFRLED